LGLIISGEVICGQEVKPKASAIEESRWEKDLALTKNIERGIISRTKRGKKKE